MKILSFEADPYPGRPKILFIGLGASSHTHSWVNLLDGSELNVRMFSVPEGGVPPNHWLVRTYLCESPGQLPDELDFGIRKLFYLRSGRLKKNPIFLSILVVRKLLNALANMFGLPVLKFDYLQMPGLAVSFEEWLSQIIRQWKPDIIHTLGLFDGQGGMYYYHVRQQFGLEKIGKWILQLRGGSDIALRRYSHETSGQIFHALAACDEIITDNLVNIEYIKELGFGSKISPISPVPGTGGVDVVDTDDLLPPSKRQRIILWPKAYESKWSKALPVLEGIKYAWNEIKPCKIVMTVVTPEVHEWLDTLPRDILSSCEIKERIPRTEMIRLVRNARVLLAPSLVDGVPNVLYEAMAFRAFPIVSPLETISPIVKDKENVLFARNLYPQEIADALIRAMTDDVLVDQASDRNLELVRRVADRATLTPKIIKYYEVSAK